MGATATPGIDQGQFLSFTVAGDEYGVGVLGVREIIEYDTVTRVPATPAYVRGVINLRGSVIPVVDLAVKFGLAATAPTKRTCVIIVEVSLGGERSVLGIMADAVSQVIELRPEEIEEPPSFGTRVRVEFVLGMGTIGNRFLPILDIDRVLGSIGLVAADPASAEPTFAEPAPGESTTDAAA